MSEDNLETLSNAELRSKLLEYGLSNVPITDSTRNVLIRKLRVSMSGGSSLAVSSPGAQKKTNRRETIHHVTKTLSADAAAGSSVGEKDEVRTTPGRANNRRTIAASSFVEHKEREKRAESHEATTAKPAPIASRRRSVRETEKITKTVPAEETRPTIILESDDEDDDLVMAAEKAEQLVEPVARSRTSRSVSLAKTGVLTLSYSQDAAVVPERGTIGENRSALSSTTVYTNKASAAAAPMAARTLPAEPRVERKSIYTIPTSRYTLEGAASRGVMSSREPNSPYASSTRYTMNPSVSAAASALRSRASFLYNEQSDDTEGNNEEDYQTPYLSTFAKNLERIKSSPIVGSGAGGGGGGDVLTRRFKRHQTYEISGRRPKDDTIRESLLKLLEALDEKYNLKRNFALLLIFLFAVFLYVLFFQ